MVSKLKIQSIYIGIITFCVALTFIPIILSFFFWIVFGWRSFESFLTPDILRGIYFILIADLSMIVGGLLVFFGYTILNRKIGLRLSASTMIVLLATSTTAGFLIDFFVFFVEGGGIDAPFWQSYNFTITFPSFLLSLIIVIHLFAIMNTAIITTCSVIVSVLFMILTFWFYAEKLRGPPTEFYAFIYMIGFVPALIIGLIYGLVISRRLEKNVRVDKTDK